MKRSIVWFRNDLRVHDNEALLDALKHSDEVIPLYIFDDRIFKSNTQFGFPKTGKHRARFVIESVNDLRKNLEKLGSKLYIRSGIPEDIIPKIARTCKTHYIYCNRERTHEEVNVQDALEQSLWSIGQEIRYYRGKMLYYTADLPFPITHCPDHFTAFRKEVEKFVLIREPLPTPKQPFATLSVDLEEGELPTMTSLNHDASSSDTPNHLIGGESQALKELNYYLWESNNVKSYKKTRNQLLGRDYSSKFSSYLAQGCLSPKVIYNEVKKYESERGANDSTYWLIFELIWRDFFRFMGKKHGNKIFYKSGTKGQLNDVLFDNKVLFDKWKDGLTGIPFIDANMKELNETGFMSNRGRQNVASFLVKDMKINWLMGAEYFESLLIDYDPCSNYGNWNYIAGVGSDPRNDRYFNIPLQTKKYDNQATYIKNWIPELQDAPLEYIINPFNNQGIRLGNSSYPQPCIHIKNWSN